MEFQLSYFIIHICTINVFHLPKINIHWKDWCWSWRSNALTTWCKEPTLWKDPDAGKDWRQEKGVTEDEMVGWRHQLNGHELEQPRGDNERQGRLPWCSPWGCTESNVTVSEEQHRAQMMGYGACPIFFNYIHPLSVRISFWLWSASSALLLCYITFYFWKSNSLQSDRAP